MADTVPCFRGTTFPWEDGQRDFQIHQERKVQISFKLQGEFSRSRSDCEDACGGPEVSNQRCGSAEPSMGEFELVHFGTWNGGIF